MSSHRISGSFQTLQNKAIIKRLTKKRVSGEWITHLAFTSDPIMQRIVRERLQTLNRNSFHSFSTAQLDALNHSLNGSVPAVCEELAVRYARERNVSALEKMVVEGDSNDFIASRKRLLVLYREMRKKGRNRFKAITQTLEKDQTSIRGMWFKTRGVAFMKGDTTPFQSNFQKAFLYGAGDFIGNRIVRKPMMFKAQLEDITQRLSDRFGKKFGGLIIVGSLSKGYSNATSDIDYFIMGSDPRVVKTFERYAKGHSLRLCWDPGLPARSRYISLSNLNRIALLDNHERLSQASALFYGVFMGNTENLSQVQRSLFEQLTEEKWEQLRNFIYQHETNLTKAFNRNNIGGRIHTTRLEIQASANIPPSFAKMKQILSQKK